MNDYAFVLNQLVNKVDPHGLFDWGSFGDPEAVYDAIEGHGPLTEPIIDGSSSTIGSKIAKIFAKRSAKNVTLLTWLHNVRTHNREITIQDDQNEMKAVNPLGVEDPLRDYARARFPDIKSKKCIQIKYLDLKDFAEDRTIVFPYDNKGLFNGSTSWWLNGAHHVYASGEVCYCPSRYGVTVFSANLSLEWVDVIDANATWKSWHPLKVGKYFVEKAWGIYDSVGRVSFRIKIPWRYVKRGK